jgi:hypothetical protein
MRARTQFASSTNSSLSLRFIVRTLALCIILSAAASLSAQDQPAPASAPAPSPAVDSAPPASLTTSPVAIVALDQSVRGAALSVAGSMQAKNGRAFITGSGSVTAGGLTADVTLPYRGTLHVCASTTVNLAADTSAPPGGMPGLLMALDHGAVEMSFATTPAGSNADTLMTPDFRILISGPGASDVKVRLGNSGDTCIDNGAHSDGTPATDSNAPYVVVTSLFDSGLYRVQPGQRVMLQHGSVHEVVDQEKEPCGCPPAPAESKGNEFPLAQSEGLAPLPPVPPPAKSDQVAGAEQVGQVVPPLVYPQNKKDPPAVQPTAPVQTQQIAPPPKPAKKPGVFTRIGHFFKDIFWT